MRVVALILAVLLTVPSCATRTANEDLRDREWTMVWVEGFPSMPAGAAQPTVRFSSDGRVSGNTGCNSAGAAYSVEGERLSIEAMIMTKRACLAREANELEGAYVRAIGAAQRYRIAGYELELLDQTDKVVARFR